VRYLRWSRIRSLILCAGLVAALFAAWPACVHALEPPRPGELQRYRLDGSLGRRLQMARRLGNDKVAPRLVERLRAQLRTARLGLSVASPPVMTPPPAWRGMPTSGNVKILTLLISFKDYPASNSAAAVQDKLFGAGDAHAYPYESLRSYYERSSYGKLHIGGDVLGWYQEPYNRDQVPQTDDGREALIEEALKYYEAQGHDFSQYDNDGDGAIDYLVVVWTGPDNGWSGFWWGYMTNFADSSFTLDGKRLGTYSWQWEANPAGGAFDPRVVIHETGHALGLPDLYDYDDTVGPSGGVGGLDMMDSNWGDHNCFSKFLLGWLTPQTITAGSQTVMLSSSGTSADALLVMPKAVAGDPFGEFYMVQNRHPVANDTDLPGDGLLVWHVDARLNADGSDYLYDNRYGGLSFRQAHHRIPAKWQLVYRPLWS
jgi:M6 family metalloprotease-like protein